MGFRFRKSINLGGGVKLNVSKKGVGVSAGVKGFRVSASSKGVRTTASLPGTGLSYTEFHSFNKNKKTKTTSVPSSDASKRSLISDESPFLPASFPKELRSKNYSLQTLLGVLGYVFIFVSLFAPFMLLLSILCLYGRYGWRGKTDPIEKNYSKAYLAYRQKKFEDCITNLDIILDCPNANIDLNLVKAECYRNLGQNDNAYAIYKNYFTNNELNNLNSFDYLTHKVNSIDLFIDNKDFDLGLKLAQSFPDGEIKGINFTLWRNYMKGLCFLGKDHLEVALECFKEAIGRKRSMDYPYIDCHYLIGIVYARLDKQGLAKKKFEKVYAYDPTYKDIEQIMDTLNSGEVLTIDFN